jgi:hypothetical protein
MTGVANVREQYALAGHRLVEITGQVLTRRLTEAVTYARATYRSASATTPTATAVRTGALRAALGSSVQVTGHTVTGTLGYVGTGVAAYAGVHEGIDGRSETVIRPTRGKFLAIPLPAARTAAGVAKGGPRDFPNTFIARSRAGNLIVFERLGNKEIRPLFLLRSEVRIKPRPALRPTVDKFLPLIVSDLQSNIAQVLKG